MSREKKSAIHRERDERQEGGGGNRCEVGTKKQAATFQYVGSETTEDYLFSAIPGASITLAGAGLSVKSRKPGSVAATQGSILHLPYSPYLQF